MVFLGSSEFANQGLALAQDQANRNPFHRDLGPTPSPKSLLSRIARFQTNPVKSTPIYSELEKVGRDIFSSLAPEQRAKAREFAEQLLENKGIDSPEVQSLMDRMGVDPDTQQQLAQQFQDGTLGSSLEINEGNPRTHRELEELVKRKNFDKAFDRIKQKDNSFQNLWNQAKGQLPENLQNMMKGQSQATREPDDREPRNDTESIDNSNTRRGDRNSFRKEDSPATRSNDNGRNTPRADNLNQFQGEDSSLNRSNPGSRNADADRRSPRTGRQDDARRSTNRNLPLAGNKSTTEEIKQLFQEIQSRKNLEGEQLLKGDQSGSQAKKRSNPVKNLDSEQLVQRMDDAIKEKIDSKQQGSENSRPDGIRNRTNGNTNALDQSSGATQNTIPKDVLKEFESFKQKVAQAKNEADTSADSSLNRAGSDSPSSRSTPRPTPTPTRPNGVQNARTEAQRISDERWAKEFYNMAREVMPNIRKTNSDLSAQDQVARQNQFKEFVKGQLAGRDDEDFTFGKMLEKGSSMLAGTQSDPKAKEKIEARVDRMLVDLAKKTVETAKNSSDDTAFESAIESMFDNAIGSNKKRLKEMIKGKDDAKKQLEQSNPFTDGSRNSNDTGNSSSLDNQFAGGDAADPLSSPTSSNDSTSAMPTLPALPKLDASWFNLQTLAYVLIGIAVISIVIVLVLKLKPAADEETIRKQKLAQRLRTMRDPDDLVDAVDLYLLAHHGEGSSWWNAKIAEEAVAEKKPNLKDSIARLFQLYVLSRYADGHEGISSQERKQAETTLTVLTQQQNRANREDTVASAVHSNQEINDGAAATAQDDSTPSIAEEA